MILKSKLDIEVCIFPLFDRDGFPYIDNTTHARNELLEIEFFFLKAYK